MSYRIRLEIEHNGTVDISEHSNEVEGLIRRNLTVEERRKLLNIINEYYDVTTKSDDPGLRAEV